MLKSRGGGGGGESLSLFIYCIIASKLHINNTRDGSRGYSAPNNTVDEFSFVKDDVLYKLVLIQLVKENRTLWFMSSPVRVEDPRSKILLTVDAEYENAFYFNTMNLATKCPECEDAKEKFCPHRLDNKADFKTIAMQHMLKIMLPDQLYDQEVLGLQVTTEELVLDREDIKWLVSEHGRYPTPSRLLFNTLFCSADPCAGSRQNSKTAFVLFYFTTSFKLVVSLLLPLSPSTTPPRVACGSRAVSCSNRRP